MARKIKSVKVSRIPNSRYKAIEITFDDDDKLNRDAPVVTAPLRDLVQHDNRRFDPTRRSRRLLNTKQQVSLLTSRGLYDKIAFKFPSFEPVCIRRQLRRKVLFALRLTGKGSGAKRHKFTASSKISCR